MINILMVCTGNICRSPMAEGLFNACFNQSQYRISSAGLGALIGNPADPLAYQIMQEKKGIDISSHRARQATQKILLDSDIIFVMEQDQKKNIEFHLPSAYGRVLRLGQWSRFDIADPYQRSKNAFEQTLVLLEECLNDWQTRL